jgi:hypothetical protein
LSLAGTTVLAVPKVEVCFGGVFPGAARPTGAWRRAKQANRSSGIFISSNIRVTPSWLRNQYEIGTPNNMRLWSNGIDAIAQTSNIKAA